MVRKIKNSKIKNLIFYPSKLGQSLDGVQLAPSRIVKNIISNENKKNYIKSNKTWVNVQKSNDIFESLRLLYIANWKVKGSRINIGGDHSMSIATVAHSLNNYQNLKLIWIDAHPDINTSYSSISGNIHGMPLGYLTNLDEDDRFDFIGNPINFKDILYIGIRDIDSFEKKVIKNISYIKPQQFNTWPFLSTVHDFIGNNPIHISFDVDSLDPQYLSSTGTKVANGLELHRTKILLDYLHKFKKNQIVNVDICELNPKLGSLEEYKRSIENLMYLFDRYI